MGSRKPGTIGLHMRQPDDDIDDSMVGTLRDLRTSGLEALDEIAGAAKMDFVQGGGNVLQLLADIYRSSNWSSGPSSDAGNATDLVSEKLPPGRERDAGRPTPSTGGGLKKPGSGGSGFNVPPTAPHSPTPPIEPQVVVLPPALRSRLFEAGVTLRLKDAKLLPDFRTLTLFGEAKATLEIPTEYPATFDAPTEIGLKITSTSISASTLGVIGSATAYKVFHADFKLQLHYDDRQLIEALVRFAKKRNLSQAEVEQLLRSMRVDGTSWLKAGPVPIAFVKLSASSLLPMRRPLLGATDELLPVQISALPGRELFIVGTQVVPKGVFFDTFVPAFGLHYSKYGREQGVSGTGAVLAKPDLDHLPDVQYFVYLDLHYAKRVSKAVDLDVGMTYTLTSSGGSGEPDALAQHWGPGDTALLQLQYLHARSKSWQPSSRDNQPEGADRSGHSVMFTIKGTFDWL
jgi:hypothetical protein